MDFRKVFLCQLILLLLAGNALVVRAEADSSNIGTVNIASEQASNRIAPGEFLPISVKLVNFGSQKRIDVAIEYKIFNNSDKEVYLQKEVYSESETVAVETTASFIKRIQIPYSFPPGFYSLLTVIHYPYQEQPAISKFPFSVEKKIGGFFKSDLIIYSIFVFLIIAVVIFATYFFTSWRRYRVISYDYSDKPKHETIYYEILSSIINQMRLRIGDTAIKIAQDIPDLEIDPKNGLILNIKQDPARLVALLIARYEKFIGKPISFDLRK